MAFPKLQTARLSLRQITPDDQEYIFRGLSHPQVIRYYGVHFDSFRDSEEQMRWFKTLEEEQTGMWWAICGLDDSQFYGAAGLNHWQQDHRKAELGFWLLPEYWGRGLMQEALMVLIRYAHEGMKIHRLEAFVETENSASARLLEKLGFNREGRMADCEIKNGRFISLDIYAHFAKSSVL